MSSADLDGLGPATGPAVTWTVPDNFAQKQPPMRRTLDYPYNSKPAGKNALWLIRWLGISFLLLGSIIFISRAKSKAP